MIERLRNAWLAFTVPPMSTEQDEDKCPRCGGSKVIDVTTIDMPLDQKKFLCGDCNHSWQREAQE